MGPYILKHHDIYPFLIIIEYSDCHADPNNYSQPMHNIIILVHNYIVVTLYILVYLEYYYSYVHMP